MKTDLLQIGDKELWNNIHKRHQDKGGAYKIIAINNGQTVPINRFLGAVDEGILYIGNATSFINRLIELKKTQKPT